MNRPRAGLKYLFTVFQITFSESACTTHTQSMLCAIWPPTAKPPHMELTRKRPAAHVALLSHAAKRKLPHRTVRHFAAGQQHV